MEVLFLLAERRGQLVTREEIIEKLWGKNTFLDTDNAINTAIRKIRQVLEDDPARPRFVQTVTGKGYRFIGRLVEGVGVSAQEPLAAEEKERKALEEGPVPPLQAAGRVKNRWAILAGALAVFAFFAIGYIYFRYAPRKHTLTETDTIVLADFTNITGDPVFDGTLRQGLAVQLEQSPFLSLVSEDRIQQVLRLMGKSADARLTPEIAREICERTASAAVLDGSIAGLGSQYVLGLRARDCHTGDVLVEEQVQAARKEEVLNALSQAASKFRTRLGESLTTVKQYNTPLAEATTPSLEALKAYSVGWQVSYSSGSAASAPFFKRAIEIDPDFASAYASLGRMYGDIGEFALSAQNTAKAYQLRDRASDQEKFFISVNYDLQVTETWKGSNRLARCGCKLILACRVRTRYCQVGFILILASMRRRSRNWGSPCGSTRTFPSDIVSSPPITWRSGAPLKQSRPCSKPPSASSTIPISMSSAT